MIYIELVCKWCNRPFKWITSKNKGGKVAEFCGQSCNSASHRYNKKRSCLIDENK